MYMWRKMTMTEEKKSYHKRRGMSEKILDVMSDKNWYTVPVVAKKIGYLETGTSAGIRSLRKEAYGRKNIIGKWMGGQFFYRLFEGVYGEKPLSEDMDNSIAVSLV